MAATRIRAIELSEYQQLSRRTAQYPRDAWLAYPALGLAGEAGEVAEHAKKAIRDDGGLVTDERRGAIAKELGDVLWYVAQIASELGLSTSTVRTHLHNVYGKLGAMDRAQAVLIATERGWI